MATLQTYHEVVCDAEPPTMRGTSVNARSVREYLGRGHCNHYKTTNGMDLIPTSPALGRAKRLSRSAVCAVAHVALIRRSGDDRGSAQAIRASVVSRPHSKRNLPPRYKCPQILPSSHASGAARSF
jgi:hypothetical protein